MTWRASRLVAAFFAPSLVLVLAGCGDRGGHQAAAEPKPEWCDTLGFAQDLLEPRNRDLRDLVDAPTWDTAYQAAGGSIAMLASTDDDYGELLAYLTARYAVEAGEEDGDPPEVTDEVREQASMADAARADGACD